MIMTRDRHRQGRRSPSPRPGVAPGSSRHQETARRHGEEDDGTEQPVDTSVCRLLGEHQGMVDGEQAGRRKANAEDRHDGGYDLRRASGAPRPCDTAAAQALD
jgi:hypothetical protein